MIKKILFSVLAIGTGLFIYTNIQQAQTFSSNPPTGRAGAPGEGDCTGCHTGVAVTGGIAITTNINAQIYTPGQTYTVTITASKVGSSKFGFQVTAVDANGLNIGEFINNGEVVIASNGAYASHNGTSTSGTDSKVWTIDWVAPPAGTGAVTFYASTNATNSDGSTSGDEVTLSSLAITEEAVTTSVPSFIETSGLLGFYPNPAQSNEAVQLLFSTSGNISLNVYDLQGKQVHSVVSSVQEGQPYSISLEGVEKGIYFLRGVINDQPVQQKLVVH